MTRMTGLRWLGASVLLLPLLAAIYIALFGWNWLRAPIERATLDKTGRVLTIRGDLTLHWGWPSPHLRAYPPKTVVAEKFHATVALGMANSRMKDYYDVWMLTGAFTLEPNRLRSAIVATFARRNTAVPALVPDGLSDAFAIDAGKQRQWDAFARNLAGSVPELRLVVSDLRQRLTSFLAPT